MWVERVRAWRSSGQTAATFADEHGFRVSALRYWSARLGRKPAAPTAPAMVRVVPRTSAAVAAVPVSSTTGAELVVEVRDARVRVARGFDPELLVAVVRALGASR